MRESGSGRSAESLLLEVLERITSIETRLGLGSRDDMDDALVLAIATSTAGLAFTGRELMKHARADATLRAALQSADCSSAREVGWFLKRMTGDHASGIRVERVADDGRDGIVWRVGFAGFSGKTREGR